jgi:hypothetical protein
MVPSFSPFLLAILESYGIQAIHLHPRSVALLAVFAYACEACNGIQWCTSATSSLFAPLDSTRAQAASPSSPSPEQRTTSSKWVKKVEDFWICCLFVDVLEESKLFLVTGEPPTKRTTWASEALPKEVLKALLPWICDLRKEGITGPMVGVDFVTRCIAPLQDHCRPIWVHRGSDNIWLHASELNADARGEVIRAFFSTAHIPTIP